MKSRYVAILLAFTVQFVKAQTVDFMPMANAEVYGAAFNAAYAEIFNECMSSTVPQGGQASSVAMNSLQMKEEYCKNYARVNAQLSLQPMLQEMPQ